MSQEEKNKSRIMSQEEKQELLVALCGYLPYKCRGKYEIVRITESETKIERFEDELDSNVLDYDFEYENFKPYLRPMSNMTEEELEEFKNFSSLAIYKEIDWLNMHYFDYRGLINKGLALKAPEDLYVFV